MRWWSWLLIVFFVIIFYCVISSYWDKIVYFFKKPRTAKGKLLKELDDLTELEKTLGNVNSLAEGADRLIKEFDLAIYILTEINIKLSKIIKEKDPLKVQEIAFRELYDEFLIGRIKENSNLIDYNKKAKQDGSQECFLLETNYQFLLKYNKQINFRIQAINTVVNNILLAKQKKSNAADFKYISLLDPNESYSLSISSELYIMIFTFENVLRDFILETAKRNGVTSIISWFNQDAKDTYLNVQQEEKSNKWEKRGNNELFYVELKHLKDIICKQWKLFAIYFKNQETFKSNMDIIYCVRCKVAHNALSISNDEITLCKIYINEILTRIK